MPDYSPAHRWGQIIGELVETALEPSLREFAEAHGLYLDRKGSRPARKTRDLVWVDSHNNKHKLDYVIERGGSAERIGTPVAFIEIAWRRYTKHSKNKAQEIEGALRPILASHREVAPFFGAILAGEFTGEALAQLRSLGCTVLYFSYDSVVEAFARVGINAAWPEGAPRELLAQKIVEWEALSDEQRGAVAAALVEMNLPGVRDFLSALAIVATRRIQSVFVLVLHGTGLDFSTVEGAIAFIEGFEAGNQAQPVVRYEIQLRYNDGSRIDGSFVDRLSAVQFLRGYQIPQVRLVSESGSTAAVRLTEDEPAYSLSPETRPAT